MVSYFSAPYLRYAMLLWCICVPFAPWSPCVCIGFYNAHPESSTSHIDFTPSTEQLLRFIPRHLACKTFVLIALKLLRKRIGIAAVKCLRNAFFKIELVIRHLRAYETSSASKLLAKSGLWFLRTRWHGARLSECGIYRHDFSSRKTVC